MLSRYDEAINSLCQQGFFIYDNFLPSQCVSQLQGMAHQLWQTKQFHMAKIGHKTTTHSNPSIRRDAIYWLDEEENTNLAIQTYFAAMKQLMATINQQLFLGLVHFETHFALYQPGSFYKKHVDQFRDQSERRISSVYYLNETWDEQAGGHLVLYDTNHRDLASISPLANRLVCFNSTLPHEVLVTHKKRLSMTGWMKIRALMNAPLPMF